MKTKSALLPLILSIGFLCSKEVRAQGYQFYWCSNKVNTMTISEDGLNNMLEANISDMNNDEHDYAVILPLAAPTAADLLRGYTQLPSRSALNALREIEMNELSRTGQGTIVLKIIGDTAIVSGAQTLTMQCSRTDSGK